MFVHLFALVAIFAMVKISAQGPPPPPPPPPASSEPLISAMLGKMDPTLFYTPLSISPPGPENPCYYAAQGTSEFVLCNLEVYKSMMTMFSSSSSTPPGLAVFSDATALWGPNVDSDSFFETFSSPTGAIPCDEADVGVSPVQVAMSCATRQANSTAVVNAYVVMPDGNKYISDFVYGPTGKVIATYQKHLLTTQESAIFTAGPFAPTVFALPFYPQHVIGLVIANEATDPSSTGDWSQFDAFKAQGAEFVVWSNGWPQAAVAEYPASYQNTLASKVKLFFMSSMLGENIPPYDGRDVNKTPASYVTGGISVPGKDGGPQMLTAQVYE